MNTDVTEIASEARLHKVSRQCVKRMAGCRQSFVHDGRRRCGSDLSGGAAPHVHTFVLCVRLIRLTFGTLSAAMTGALKPSVNAVKLRVGMVKLRVGDAHHLVGDTVCFLLMSVSGGAYREVSSILC